MCIWIQIFNCDILLLYFFESLSPGAATLPYWKLKLKTPKTGVFRPYTVQKSSLIGISLILYPILKTAERNLWIEFKRFIFYAVPNYTESYLLFLFAKPEARGSAFRWAEESDIASFYGSPWYFFFGLNFTEGLDLSGYLNPSASTQSPYLALSYGKWPTSRVYMGHANIPRSIYQLFISVHPIPGLRIITIPMKSFFKLVTIMK